MRCLIKIPHQHLIYSFLFVAFLSFLSVFGFASDSYATSSTCSFSFSGGSGGSSSLSSHCSGFSDSIYFRINSFIIDFSNSSTSSITLSRIRSFFRDSNSLYNYNFYDLNNLSISVPARGSYSFTDFSSGFPFIFSNFQFTSSSTTSVLPLNFVSYFTVSSGSLGASYSITIEYSSNLSDLIGGQSCPEPEEPEPCPPIPENPYDDKLDEIKKAIYCASAVMIMIYFFFIVYKIIVKDGGRR